MRKFPKSLASTAFAAAAMACVTTLASTAALAAAEISYLNETGNLPDGLPFSEAVRVNDTLYLSGQVGNRPGEMATVPGGIGPESRQALMNIRSVLEANGLGLSDVVKCTVMLEDIDEWGAFNEVYQEFFSAPYPARSAFGADGLALGARVEIECMAAYES